MPDTLNIESGQLAVYQPFYAQLAELKSTNAKLVFDYETPDGNKEARSHVYKLRQSKAAVDRKRQEEKKESLEYGRKVDAEAYKIIGAIEEMIEVHQNELDAIEKREAERKDALEASIQALRGLGQLEYDLTSDIIGERLEKAKETDPAQFQERTSEAALARSSVIKTLEDALAASLKREAEAVELERLRKEAADREQAEADARRLKEQNERLEREAREAEERETQRLADEAAAEEKRLADAYAAEQKRIADEAERERIAKERETKAAEDAAAAERKRIADEAEAKRVADEAREADIAHQKKIHQDIVHAMTEALPVDFTAEQAKALIVAIRKGEIPHIQINY